jgi:hypothetical protein
MLIQEQRSKKSELCFPKNRKGPERILLIPHIRKIKVKLLIPEIRKMEAKEKNNWIIPKLCSIEAKRMQKSSKAWKDRREKLCRHI